MRAIAESTACLESPLVGSKFSGWELEPARMFEHVDVLRLVHIPIAVAVRLPDNAPQFLVCQTHVKPMARPPQLLKRDSAGVVDPPTDAT